MKFVIHIGLEITTIHNPTKYACSQWDINSK